MSGRRLVIDLVVIDGINDYALRKSSQVLADAYAIKAAIAAATNLSPDKVLRELRSWVLSPVKFRLDVGPIPGQSYSHPRPVGWPKTTYRSQPWGPCP